MISSIFKKKFHPKIEAVHEKRTALPTTFFVTVGDES
jgi:hypothetical protein